MKLKNVTWNPIPNATKGKDGWGAGGGQTDREAGQTLCNHKPAVFVPCKSVPHIQPRTEYHL